MMRNVLECHAQFDPLRTVKSSALTTIDSAPRTFGGLPVPNFIDMIAHDAADRYVRYCANRVRFPAQQATYAAAISRFCEWMEVQDHKLWNLSPVLVSAYLETRSLDGASLESVRVEWLALRVLFDWCYSVGLVQTNAAATVADPTHGFFTDREAESDHPGVIDLPATLRASA